MAINSRSKGCKAERDVAKLFKIWTKKEFARTPSSGGLQWKSSNSKGDIVCTTEGHYFPFCIEIKFHREIDFSHLLNPKIKLPKILEFWQQCLRDATKAGKVPMLLMRYNGMPADFYFMVLPQAFFYKVSQGVGRPDIGLLFTKYNPDLSIKYNLQIIPSTDFFKLRYKPIKLIAKTYIKDGKSKK